MKKTIGAFGAILLFIFLLSLDVEASAKSPYQNLISPSLINLSDNKVYYDGDIKLERNKDYSFVATKEFFGSAYNEETKTLTAGNVLGTSFECQDSSYKPLFELDWYFLGVFGGHVKTLKEGYLHINDFLVRGVSTKDILKNQVILYEGDLSDFKGFTSGPYLGDYDYLPNNHVSIKTQIDDAITITTLKEKLFAYDTTDGVLNNVEVLNNNYNPNALGDYEVLFKANDSSLNEVAYQASISVVDETPPRIIKDSPMIWPLGSPEPTLEDFLEHFHAEDNLDPNPVIYKIEMLGTYSTVQPKSIPVTFYAKDASGNIKSMTDGFDIEDITGPTITPKNEELKWSMEENSPTLNDIKAMFTLTDNLDTNPVITSFNLSPNYQKNVVRDYILTVNAKDALNNTSTENFTLKEVDKTAPRIIKDSPVIWPLGSEPPALEDFLEHFHAEDNYDPNPVIYQIEFLGTYSYDYPKSIAVTFYAKDASGNSKSMTDGFDIEDLTGPTITPKTEELIWDASKNAPTIDDIKAMFNVTDNYDPNPVITSFSLNQTYVKNKIRTYTLTVDAEDSSHNQSHQSFTLNEVDLTPPEISLRYTAYWMLGSEPPTLETFSDYVEITDVIDKNPFFTKIEVLGEYSYTEEKEVLFRIYGQDASGNESYLEDNLVLWDDTPPNIVGIINMDWSMEDDAPTNSELRDRLIIVDNIDPDPFVYRIQYLDYEYVKGVVADYELKVIVSDRNGNKRTLFTTLHVKDLTPPIINKIGLANWPLGSPAPSVDDIKAWFSVTDNYDPNPYIYEYELLNTYHTDKECSVAINVYAKDASGNIRTFTNGFEVVDMTGPTISKNEDIYWPMESEAPKKADLINYFTVTDNYDQNPVISEITVANYQKNVVKDFQITVKAVDKNGNITILNDKFTTKDTTPPVVEKIGEANWPLGSKAPSVDDIKAWFSVTDNYDSNPYIYEYELLNTYHTDKECSVAINVYAKDASGNTRTFTNGFEVIDMTAPVVTELEKLSWPYQQAKPSLADFKDSYLVVDNLDGEISLFDVIINDNEYASSNPNKPCPITLVVKDNKENQDTFISELILVDKTAPIFISPTHLYFEVGGAEPTLEDIKAQIEIEDNWDPNPTIRSFSISGGFKNEVGDYQITYYIYDKDNNLNEATYQFNVIDTTAPSFTLKPISINLSELGTYMVDFDPDLVIETVSDNSGSIAKKEAYISSNVGSKNYFVGNLELTVKVTDGSGNYQEEKTTLTVIDDILPEVYIKTIEIETTTSSKVDFDEIVRKLSKNVHARGINTDDITIIDCAYTGNEEVEGDYEIRYMYQSEGVTYFEVATISVVKPFDDSIDPNNQDLVNGDTNSLDNQNINQAVSSNNKDIITYVFIALAVIPLVGLVIYFIVNKRKQKMINK